MRPKRVQGTKLAHTKEEEALGIPGVGGDAQRKSIGFNFISGRCAVAPMGRFQGGPRAFLGVSVAVPLRCQSWKQEGRQWLLRPE